MQRRGEQKVVNVIGTYFHHATPDFGPDVEVNQNKAWGAVHLQKAIDGFAYFNTVLRHHPYVAGANFSMTGITVFTGLNFSEAYPKIMVPKSLTALAEWRARMQARLSCAFSTRTMKESQ